MSRSNEASGARLDASFDGKVALITGGASGIGAATARLLAGQGATVILGDIKSGQPEDALSLPAGCEFVELDVTSEAMWSTVMTGLLQRHGRLDVLVNAAGIVGDVAHGALDTTSLAEWRRVLAVNLDGIFLGCREAVAAMKLGSGRGAIVNLSSVGAYYPTSQSVAYGASKGAVMQLSKSVAWFGSRDGLRIRCNSVHPGRTATPMLAEIGAGRQQRGDDAATREVQGSANRIPLGPEGQPEDVASLIAYLASDEAAYITGSEFVVDGGWRLLR